MGLYSESSSLQANTLGTFVCCCLANTFYTPGACDLSALAGAQVTVADVLPLRLYLPRSFFNSSSSFCLLSSPLMLLLLLLLLIVL